MTLKFPGYEKAGDALSITFDPAVTDGLSHPGVIVLSIPSSQIEVRITKSNYQKLAQ